jgi:hypothetical protein
MIKYTFNSSDDEIDILLHGTPEQKRKMCRRNSNVTRDSSSEDDFEKELNADLNGQIKEIERRRGSVSGRSLVCFYCTCSFNRLK